MELKPARPEDFDLFFKIKSDYNNIAWGGFEAAPERDRFLKWYLEQLRPESGRQIFIMWEDQIGVGFGSLQNIGIPEISSGVLTEYTGRGYSTAIHLQAELFCRSNMIQSWIAEDNFASVRVIQKCGYTQTGKFDYRNLPLLGGTHKFYQWIKEI